MEILKRIDKEEAVAFLSVYACLSDELINKYKNYWGGNYEDVDDDSTAHYFLEENKNLILSIDLLERFEDKWSWGVLSGNEALPWSTELIERFEDKWNWQELSNNEALPWSTELIEKYENIWNLKKVAKNSGVSGSIKTILIERFQEVINRDIIFNHEGDYRYSFGTLSGNKFLIWSSKLIDDYKDYWDWNILSDNDALPWSLDLIERFKDRWALLGAAWDRIVLFRFPPWVWWMCRHGLTRWWPRVPAASPDRAAICASRAWWA